MLSQAKGITLGVDPGSGLWSKVRPDLLIFGIALAAGLHTLCQPLGRDQGICSYIATDILQGGMPYKDAWDIRPPGIYYVDALAIWLFGKTGFALRLLDWLMLSLTAVAIGRLGTFFIDRRSGTWAGILFAVAYFLGNDFWAQANGDTYVVLPMVLTMLCLAPQRRGPQSVWDFAAGLLIAWIVLMRYSHGLIMLPALAMIFGERFAQRPYGWLRRSGRAASLGAGFVISLGGYLLYLHLHGALHDFLYTVFVFAPQYVAVTSGGKVGFMIGLFFWKHFILLVVLSFIIVPALLTVKEVAHEPRRYETVVLLLWIITMEIGIVMMGKYFNYHWFPLYAPLCILAGRTYADTFGKRRKDRSGAGWKKAVIVACLAVFILFVGKSAVFRLYQTVAMVEGRLTRAQYLRSFDRVFEAATFSASGNYAGAAYLRAHTTADDTVLMWGFDPLILFLADRKSPTRFITNFSIIATYCPPTWYRELLNDVRQKTPRYIVVGTNDFNKYITGQTQDSLALLPTFPELNTILHNNYQYETTIGNNRYYRLTAGTDVGLRHPLR
ncbi:MAG TPA: glycosyltransferase family 39 protein [bacterium]|nr:glycosyltransferase family 39 protein [bacterium]